MKVLIRDDRHLFQSLSKAFSDFQKNNNLLFQVSVPNETLDEIFHRHVSKTPIFRKRPLWDCSVCRHAIRQVARIVAIDDDYNRLSFIKYVLDRYDLSANYPFLNDMFNDMDVVIVEAPIRDLFWNKETVIGAKETLERSTKLVFNHFFFNVDERFVGRSSQDVHSRVQAIKATVSKYKDYIDYLHDIVSFIEEGFVYRGREKLKLLEDTLELLKIYNRKKPDIECFSWRELFSNGASFNRDVISTLLDDLISGEDPNSAIASYNLKVAPSNYRQPKTNVVSRMQIQNCEKALNDLGFSNFVDGFAYAVPQDITILDVLWTNRRTSKQGNLTDLLADSVKPTKVDASNVECITFNDFLNLLKTACSVEVDVSSLEKVVLIKDTFDEPVYAWGNHIAFCYQTGLADVDEVTRVVKDKGGVIDAKIRFSLYWENLDDLDLHLEATEGHIHIFYACKSMPLDSGFELDIDMNVRNPIRGAVENIFARELLSRDMDRTYILYVHNYTRREKPQRCILNVYVNNRIEKTYEFKNPPDGTSIELLRFRVGNDGSIKILKSNKQAEKSVVRDPHFVMIDTVLLSPNYWTEGMGNKHVFFLKKDLDITTDNIRPYNVEQLRNELQSHRKVLQILSKRVQIKGEPSLVGFGISFSKKRDLYLRVNGRPYKVHIDPLEDIKKERIEAVVCHNKQKVA